MIIDWIKVMTLSFFTNNYWQKKVVTNLYHFVYVSWGVVLIRKHFSFSHFCCFWNSTIISTYDIVIYVDGVHYAWSRSIFSLSFSFFTFFPPFLHSWICNPCISIDCLHSCMNLQSLSTLSAQYLYNRRLIKFEKILGQ